MTDASIVPQLRGRPSFPLRDFFFVLLYFFVMEKEVLLSQLLNQKREKM